MPSRFIKARVVQLLGGACSRCGYSRCHRALQFHHLDPATKNRRVHHNTILRQVEQHPELFILLCANCHFEEHEAQDLARMPSAICATCSTEYKVRNHVRKLGITRFCSRACKTANLIGRPSFNPLAYKVRFVTVICPTCSREFSVRSYVLTVGRGRYCSRQCSSRAPRSKRPKLMAQL